MQKNNLPQTDERLEEMDSNANHFIHQIIEEEQKPGGRTYGQKIHTRFPPEPNGLLHIGHAKAICLDFGTAQKYGGLCNLRMDDTNPAKEEQMFIDAIKEDIHWLGYDWGDRFYYASSYFEQMYEAAQMLIRRGKAYVDDQSPEEIRESRGDFNRPGTPSPNRDRSVEENLDLFARMRAGEFQEGEKTLRAKIDMESGNMNMRDPVLYRIAHKTHHQTGDAWCIYPMYDFAHPLEDAIEGVNYSLCTVEFEAHRPLYNWVIEETQMDHQPRQIEFARLNMTNTVMSKRKLRHLVEEGLVDGWDDPRLPTLCGMRRRGYPPEAIVEFIESVGVSKTDSMVDYRQLEYFVRDHLNRKAPRAMAVLDPIRLVIDNFPEDDHPVCRISNHPKDPDMGSHTCPFGKELWIERADFEMDPPKKYFRLYPGNEVRLMNAYIVKCTSYETDESGRVSVVHADYEPDSFGGNPSDGRKIKGTIHWVPVSEGVACQVKCYEPLFTVENPDGEDRDYVDLLNPNSCQVLSPCYVEPWLVDPSHEPSQVQFMRQGYFVEDRKSTPTARIYNQIVSLRDSYQPGK